ncbi:GH1 family beta-glucosidase [Azospirillum sp. TSO22-1]|uniref:GH1 family beta-glucosidase n=1 Tax=Azospirillum sp. TSO22-1 TaxID=716789 RepID=UPI000D61CA2C|nr:GH1 family beta-glucosidase [Azospirillum sp. TSO22-1]PWC31532.1 beta-glucosidase [Azospirillum sp. TSO22-1]
MRRRTFLKAAATSLAGARLGPALAQAPDAVRFPDGFLWGCSTSSYQIEGATGADGRGPSVWDTFSRTPGKVLNGDTGDTACDHYNRWPEDVALMARAGMRAYRFSVAWPRVLPNGTGPVNAAGLDFYDRLVDGLLKAGIEPWPCLYHWDLPQALQDRGGWTNREIAGWFADYAQVVAGRLGDRVSRWVMLNEPSVVAIFGHGMGTHAPGLTGRATCVAALHHQNLAQGAALQALRAAGRGWTLGTVLSLQPVKPVGGLEANRAAAALWDAVWNRSGLDPLFHGRIPELLAADFEPLVRPGDLELIRQPIDFLGINYYSRMHQQPDSGGLFGTGYGPAPEGVKRTGMGWPVEPDGLTEQLLELRERYGNPPVYLTENGADYYDWIGPEGKAEDGERIFFIRDHLLAGHAAIRQGANLKGWFVWTLLDNFEWADGYSRRFGLVQVDRQTMTRTPKASYHWYADAIRRNGVMLA